MCIPVRVCVCVRAFIHKHEHTQVGRCMRHLIVKFPAQTADIPINMWLNIHGAPVKMDYYIERG